MRTTVAFVNDYPGKLKPWSKTNGGAISAADLDAFSIETSNFTELDHAIVGGAIYIVSQIQQRTSIPSNPIYNIIRWNFIRNKAYEGGAIYIDYIDYAKIDSWVFDSNSAYLGNYGTGNGGAIKYSSSGTSQFLLIFFRSLFKSWSKLRKLVYQQFSNILRRSFILEL